jgi:aspartate aminotransferase
MSNRRFSQIAETLIPSEIVKLGGIIREKINNGEQIFNYTIGDFDSAFFPIPEILEQEIIKAYQNRYTTYPPADGDFELRTAVSDFIRNHQGVSYKSDEILIAAGGRPLIYTVYRTIVDEGDKVIYPVPSWNNNHYAHFTGGKHVCLEATADNNFMPTAEQIAPHLEGASLLALCSPLNPTGTVFDKNELKRICDLVIAENKRRPDGSKKLYLMYDQIYWTLTFGNNRHHDPVSLHPEMKDYTIFIDGISKSFAATGVRVGWAMGPADIIAKMKGLNSHIGAWAPLAEQKAVAAFLKQSDAVDNYLKGFKNQVESRLNSIYEGFCNLKALGFNVDAIQPQAAIYLTISIDLKGKKTAQGNPLTTQEDVTNYILNEGRLAIVPFHSFGAGNDSSWYRLSVGCCKMEDIPVMLEKLKSSLEKLI